MFWWNRFWLCLFRWWTGWYVTRHDPNDKCPACGNFDGKIRLRVYSAKEAPLDPLGEIYHHCNVCQAEWSGGETVRPAVKWHPKFQEVK